MATTFPGQMLDITVELFLNNEWTDVSSYVFYKDKISIHIGLSPEDTGHDGSAQYCYLTFKNADKRFSPRFRFGPYYGSLGPNTPLRVKWNSGNGDKTRFEGFVPNWDPKIPVNDARNVRIAAYDWRQQLQTGSGRKQPYSPIYLSTIRQSTLVTYVPLEDMANTAIPTNINGPTVAVSGTINYETDNDLPGSKSLPTFTSDSYYIISSELGHNYEGNWQYDFFYKLHNYPSADYVLKRVWVTGTGTSGIAFWDVIMGNSSYRVKAYSRTGVQILDSGPFLNSGWIVDGWMHHRLMVANQTSTTFKYNFVSFPVDPSLGGFSIGEVTGVTGQAGTPGAVSMLPSAERDGDAGGHYAFYQNYNFSAVDDSGDAYNGEPPGTRWTRLLDEYSIPNVRRTPAWADTTAMGRQGKESDLISNLRECLYTNEGFMDATYSQFDTAEEAGGLLRFTERGYIEEKDIGMTLSYADGVLYALDANDDDFSTVNSFTARRSEGASAQVVQTRGNKNINLRTADRLGVGPYDSAADFSLDTDAQTIDHAGWAVNQGTVDEMRVTNCEIWFERIDAVSANVLATYEGLDTWDRTKITHLPDDYGGDAEAFDFFIAGRDEEFDQFTLHVNIYGPPASPWKVAILDSDAGADSDQRIDLDASRTMGPLDDSQTTVQTWDESSLLFPSKWDDVDGDYVLTIDGEDFTVSAVADVTKSFVGAGTAASADNANITPTIHASSAKNDLMVLVMYCRNTGVLVFPELLDDWEQADTAEFDNFKVYTRVHSGTEADPTCVISSGSAGDTFIAQVATFRGIAPHAIKTASQSNSASTNIAFPALDARRINCLFLAIGGMTNDWTSVATASGWTAEIGEPDSTAGTDAGLVWDYVFGTSTGYATSSGSFSVTGGTSVTSQAIVLAIDGNVQQLTVARGVNLGGTGIAHPEKQEVHTVDTNSLILAI